MAAITKKAYTIYMFVKKLSLYLGDAHITFRSDQIPLWRFLGKYLKLQDQQPSRFYKLIS